MGDIFNIYQHLPHSYSEVAVFISWEFHLSFFRSLSRLLQGESEVSNDFGVHLRDLWQGNWIKLRFALKFIIYVSICSGQSYILPIALQNKQIVSLSCRIFGFASWFQLQHVYINTRNIIKIVFRISNQIIRHATKMFGQFWPQHNSMSNTKKNHFAQWLPDELQQQ